MAEYLLRIAVEAAIRSSVATISIHATKKLIKYVEDIDKNCDYKEEQDK